MKLNFELPTPNACVDCKFHYITSSERYGKWTMACLIDSKIQIPVAEGVKQRNEKCPGVLEDN